MVLITGSIIDRGIDVTGCWSPAAKTIAAPGRPLGRSAPPPRRQQLLAGFYGTDPASNLVTVPAGPTLVALAIGVLVSLLKQACALSQPSATR